MRSLAQISIAWEKPFSTHSESLVHYDKQEKIHFLKMCPSAQKSEAVSILSIQDHLVTS